MKMSGARIVLESLKREGADVMFGLPGGAVLPLYDALYDFPGPLRHVLVRHEAAAGHAAEGYARVTGKVGVCLVTSGPAATNLVTALQDAYMDSMPIVALHRTGADAPHRQRRVPGSGQRRDHPALHEAQLPREGHQGHRPGDQRGVPHRGDRPSGPGAHRPAEGRPHEAGRVRRIPTSVHLRSYNPTYEGHPGQVKKAAKAIDARPPRGALRGRRGHRVRRGAGAPGAGRADAHPGDDDPHGPGRLPLGPPPVARHARHARRLRPEHGGLQLRLPDRGRRAVRRPGDGQGGPVRAAGRDHPHRRRPLLDLEEHQGARPDRGRRPARPGAAGRGAPPGERRPADLAGAGGPGPVAPAARPVAAEAPVPLRLGRRDDQAPVRRGGGLQPHEGRGDHRDRRRPAPDVGRPALPLPPPAALADLRRARARWATACRRPSAPRSAVRTAWSCSSTATGAS